MVTEATEVKASPSIYLPPSSVICGRHGEHFRQFWPRGYQQFTLQGLQILLTTEHFQKESEGKIELATDLLRIKPICCRLTPDEIYQLYLDLHEELHLWTAQKCEKCKMIGIGGPYRFVNFWRSKIIQSKHTCFECVAYYEDQPTIQDTL